MGLYKLEFWYKMVISFSFVYASILVSWSSGPASASSWCSANTCISQLAVHRTLTLAFFHQLHLVLVVLPKFVGATD